MSDDVELNVNDEPLRKVIDDIEDGKYRIPEFQREFVWDRGDVIDLFDSIYSSYPIGSFFFWRVPEGMWDFFRDVKQLEQPTLEEVRNSPFPEVNFVLDGQQRLTSLYITLMGLEHGGTDYGRIVFDLDKEEFKVADGKADHLIRVCDMWADLEDARDGMSDRRKKTYNKCRNRLREYEMPLIIVNSADVDSVIDIFERINQKGTRLSRFDIVNANIWSEEFNLRKRIEEDVLKPLNDIGFGEISKGTVTQALALNIVQNCSTSAQKNLDAEEVERDWEDTKDSIIHAVDYLKNKHGVKRVEFLPYPSLVPVLSHYLFEADKKSPDAEHTEYIDQWFWRASLSNRYNKATQVAMTEDAERFRDVIEGEEVSFDFVPQFNKENLIQTNIKRSKYPIRNAFLCLLAKNNPKHFENGTKIDLTKNQYTDFRLNKHHIFPNAFLRREGHDKEDRKSIMCITFIPEELNKSIQDTEPSEYFSSLRESDNFEEVMKSHLIPYDDDSGIWDDDYDRFREQRADLVYSELEKLVGEYSGIESSIQQDPEEAIDEIEMKIRDFIDEKLKKASEGEEYWGHIPNEVNSNVERNLSEKDKSNIETERDKLDYCYTSDYGTIINSCWDVFEDHFPSTEEVHNRFEDLTQFRNSVAHNRELDRFTKLDGKIAMEWIDAHISESEE